MSLILDDPTKYKEMRDKFEKEDEETLKNTITFMRDMDDADIGEFLDFLGKFFHHIRVNNKVSLRSFCLKYNLDPVIVSEIERGLRLPNLDLMDIYLRDDVKVSDDDTPEITKTQKED